MRRRVDVTWRSRERSLSPTRANTPIFRERLQPIGTIAAGLHCNGRITVKTARGNVPKSLLFFRILAQSSTLWVEWHRTLRTFNPHTLRVGRSNAYPF
jgi:hypothetical protein